LPGVPIGHDVHALDRVVLPERGQKLC
jgi:hypothetical protein